jgi:[NiFe] hydrogenase diaphorase moiety large subunit
VGNVLLEERLDRILEGRGEAADLDYLSRLAETIRTASRCGLGQTSPNPVLSSLASFRDAYERLIQPARGSRRASFVVSVAVGDAVKSVGRESVVLED